jgi:hypothetical protein
VNIKANRVHKAHSTRDVFYNKDGDRYSTLSRRGEAPNIEFPPTLPRTNMNGGGGGPAGFEDSPPRSRMDDFGGSRPLVKARSYADWDGGQRHAGGGGGDMARLETEFRDAHLMRLPDGKVSEREYHHQESMSSSFIWAENHR